MSKVNMIGAPGKKEKFILRILILLGLLSLANFFYWFLKPELIQNQLLFWLMVGPMIYDSLRIIYIWYHYWDITVPRKPVSVSKPTADVLTTFFPGEPYKMVKQTLLAIKKIRYPHNTYLCDEANDQHLKEFCKRNDIIHVTRNNRVDAKAGNINNALKQATGEICLILDPDHVPMENFLDEVIPYFEDEKVGFVQSVQAYYNIEESYVAKGAAEQTFQFYGPMMMSMNSYGTVNAIGANCVFRRKALDSIGGHAAGLSEDMHTSMQLHAQGWKSVYVPAAFTKGLAPASLTSYYKQQLKWSRGTLELLFSVYPKLFSKFNWRQKLHYGILPLYYFSGLIVLIAMLIPIFSLFSANIPWNGNVINFGIIVTPVFLSVFGIRFYIQRWLWHHSERGFHFMGGILLVCTWWIFLLGAVYTIIRKKVPYLPTPKEDKDATSFKLLIPNITIAVFSLIAIAYGLSIDLTPFSLFMAGFAFMNAGFMFFTLVFAWQKQRNILFSFDIEVQYVFGKKFLDKAMLLWQKAALPLTFVFFIVIGTMHYQKEYVKWLGVKPEPVNKNLVSYLGIYAPEFDNGFTHLGKVQELKEQINDHFDIISLYLAWDSNTEPELPISFLDSVYNQKALPLITWEPWINFIDQEKEGRHVFDLIEEGYFDDYIQKFAGELKSLNRPVFFRFAHEFDNPYYPWYAGGHEGSAKFKKAWIHAYEIFKKIGAENVIWVWNPWKPGNVKLYYPGKEYVDWMGVNILNYGRLNEDEHWYDFTRLYRPFHAEFQKLPQTPVMITEMGSLRNEPNQSEWFREAFSAIENDFQEIKSVIYFHSNVDDNLPYYLLANLRLDWTIEQNHVLNDLLFRTKVPDYMFSTLPEVAATVLNNFGVSKNTGNNIIGINLKQRKDWRQDYQVLNRKKLLEDFKKIKTLGINTIKFEGSSVYQYNILKTAGESNLNIAYGFWIPSDLDFIENKVEADKLKLEILRKIEKHKDKDHIKSWNLQNDVQYNQKDVYLKPRLFYQNNAYIVWLKDLVGEIKKIDSVRPVIVDIEVNKLSVYHSKKVLGNVEGIDCLGLVVKEDSLVDYFIDYLKTLNINYQFSEVSAEVIAERQMTNAPDPFFVTSWQDQHESSKLSFDGLIDRKGRYKNSYFSLLNFLKNENIKNNTPKVKILKPSMLIYEGMRLDYHAMIYDEDEGWKFGNQAENLYYEWSLVKCDIYGNPLAIKDIGYGSPLTLEIPHSHEYFRLLLTVSNGETISTHLTDLHTSL
jgi:cellulose synthase (UDP-forming)